MLEHPDDDARRDTLFLSNRQNLSLTPGHGGLDGFPADARYKEVRRPGVGFILLIGWVTAVALDENILLAVQKQVRRLVKEAEPQMVVRHVPEA